MTGKARGKEEKKKTHATPILGFDSCRAMGLVTIENRVLKMSHTEVAAVKTVDLPPTISKYIAE